MLRLFSSWKDNRRPKCFGCLVEYSKTKIPLIESRISTIGTWITFSPIKTFNCHEIYSSIHFRIEKFFFSCSSRSSVSVFISSALLQMFSHLAIVAAYEKWPSILNMLNNINSDGFQFLLCALWIRTAREWKEEKSEQEKKKNKWWKLWN